MQITYRNSLADIVLFTARRQWARPSLILGLAAAAAAIVQFLLPGDEECRVCMLVSFTFWALVAFVFLCGLQLACHVWWLARCGGYRLFDPLTVELRERSLVGSMAAASCEVGWADVLAASVTRDYVFLYVDSSFVFCIPARAFPNPAAFGEFAARARRLQETAAGGHDAGVA